MANYRISFFKLKKEEDDKGKERVTGEEYLGCVNLTDHGTSRNFTLTAKAFRVAPNKCLLADKTIVERWD